MEKKMVPYNGQTIHWHKEILHCYYYNQDSRTTIPELQNSKMVWIYKFSIHKSKFMILNDLFTQTLLNHASLTLHKNITGNINDMSCIHNCLKLELEHSFKIIKSKVYKIQVFVNYTLGLLDS